MPVIRTYVNQVRQGDEITGAWGDWATPSSINLTAQWDDSGPDYITTRGAAYVRFDTAALNGYAPSGISGGFFVSYAGAVGGSGIPRILTVRPDGYNRGSVNSTPTTTDAFSTFPEVAFLKGDEIYLMNNISISAVPGGVWLLIAPGILSGLQKFYIDVNCTAPVPYPMNHLPAGGFVYKAAPITFSWLAKADNIYGTVTQTAAKFRWRPQGAGSYTEINISGATNSYTVPENTFTTDFIEWQVQVQTNGGWSSVTEWFTLTTVDSAPNAAVAVSPKDSYAYSDQEIIFDWQHVIDTGTPQTKADLQYSLAGGAWTGFATPTGAETSVTIAPSTIPAGQLRWRVRTYNTANVAGEWSAPAAFVAIGTPPTPVITGVSQSNRPTVTWQSTGQIAYQVQLLKDGLTLIDTGEVAGTGKALKLPDYIQNGAYLVRLAIKNASLLWSAWTELGFTLSVAAPETPVLSAVAVRGGAVLTFAGTSVYSYLLRNGVPMADVTGLVAYTDYAALGATDYILRTVDEFDNYADSLPVFVNVSVNSAIMAASDALGTMTMLKQTRGEPRRIEGSFTQNVTHLYFSGRKKPVAVYPDEEFEQYALPVAFTDRAEYNALMDLIRRQRNILYRDIWGNRWFVSVDPISNDQDQHAAGLVLTMTVVDYVERIRWR